MRPAAQESGRGAKTIRSGSMRACRLLCLYYCSATFGPPSSMPVATELSAHSLLAVTQLNVRLLLSLAGLSRRSRKPPLSSPPCSLLSDLRITFVSVSPACLMCLFVSRVCACVVLAVFAVFVASAACRVYCICPSCPYNNNCYLSSPYSYLSLSQQ